MTDEQLRRLLRSLDAPVEPDPGFAESLFAELEHSARPVRRSNPLLVLLAAALLLAALAGGTMAVGSGLFELPWSSRNIEPVLLPSSEPVASETEEPRPDPTPAAAATEDGAKAGPPTVALPMLGELAPGTLGEVVTDNLVLRSAPAIAPDSEILPARLDAPARVYVAAGPVAADGYTWFQVDGLGPDGERLPELRGWVAAASRDGEQWLRALGRASGSWLVETYPGLPIGATRGAATSGPDGVLYLFGGELEGSGEATAQSWIYHLATDAWQEIAPMPTPRSRASAVLADDGRVWVIGGHGIGLLPSVELYDPAADRWQVGPSLPTEAVAFGMTATPGPDGRIYVFSEAGVWVADAAGGPWQSLASGPLDVRQLVLSDGRVHVVDGKGAMRAFDHERGLLGSLVLPRMMRSGGAAVATPEGRILHLGGNWVGPGCAAGDGDLRLVEAYSPRSLNWLTFAPLPDGFIAHRAVVVDDHVVVIGRLARAAAGPETATARFEVPAPVLPVAGEAGVQSDRWRLAEYGCESDR